MEHTKKKKKLKKKMEKKYKKQNIKIEHKKK